MEPTREKKGKETMKRKKIITSLLSGIGILLFLAAAFDLIPRLDNLLVFLGIACFIVNGVINKILKK